MQEPLSAARKDSEPRERTPRAQELREQTLGDRPRGGMAERGVNNSAADVAAATIQQEGLQIPDIRFDFDEYKIKPENQAILKAGARALAQQTSSTLVIEGHCDERGTVEYNLALGQRRADEAAKFLMDLGIAKERIKTISYGEEMPLDKGHNEENWAKNRRDHFVVSQSAR
ncbi:MAG: peptidoglycan-associated lipoprotein Pal [Syntrophales bacterium]